MMPTGNRPPDHPSAGETCASLDIGSNSVKLFVARRVRDPDSAAGWQKLADRTEITRLAYGIADTGRLADEAMDRTLAVLGRYADEARDLGARMVAVVGTMGLRSARNAEVFLERARRECGLEIEIITGEEEARLSYRAVRWGLDLGEAPTCVFDIGGGSTEFILGRGEQILALTSLPVGALRLTAEHLHLDPNPAEEVASLLAALDGELASLSELVGEDPLATVVGVGGTPTNLSAIKQGLKRYNPDLIRGSNLTVTEIEGLLQRLRCLPLAERRQVPGLEPKRAEVIVAGTAIILVILGKLELTEMTVSDLGVRHGLLVERFGS